MDVFLGQLRAELRRHPALAVQAAGVAQRWSIADREPASPASTFTVTPEMVSELSGFLWAVERATDNPGLRAAVGRLLVGIHEQPLAGLPVDAAVEHLKSGLMAVGTVDDAWVRLGGRERGLAGEGQSLLVPAAAHAGGAQGTRWRTDLVVTNVGTFHAVATIALLPRNQPNPEPEEITLELFEGQSIVLDDVLESSFDFNGAAALRIDCIRGSIVATSRTFNLDGVLGSPDARTFGQFVPALSDDDAVSFGDQGRLLLLAHDPTFAQGQRTNLIMVNGGREPIEVEVELFRSDGTELGEITQSLGAWEYRQIDRVFEEVTPAEVDDGYAVIEVETIGGSVFALASVVDNLTGDPVAVPTILRSPFEERVLQETQIVQAAAKVEGVGDTDWRTDLVLHGYTGVVATASVELLPRGQENPAPTSQILQIPNGQSLRYDDVIDSLFETEGAASIRVTPYGGAAGVSSRTYNLLGAGNSAGYPAGATFGQFLGPTGYTQSFTFGDEAWIPHLSHDPSLTKGSRTNLGLVNNATREIDIEIDLFRGDGTLLGRVTKTLRMWENVQIGRVFEQVTGESVEGGYAIVRTTHPAGSFSAHGSVVDNRTGDPITVDAVAIRGAEPAGVVASGDMLMQLFESGFDPSGVFELLRTGGLATHLDGIADTMWDRVERTVNGAVFDLGPATVLGGAMVASGRVGLVDASTTDGTTVSGSVSIVFDETAVNGRTPVVNDLELGLDLTAVADGEVAGTVTLGSAALAKSVTDFGGSLEFDTRICERYPIGGSITVTIGGEPRTLTFSNRCDGGFEIDVPSASFHALSMSMRDCDGNEPVEPQTLHLVQEDGNVAVDPSGSPETTGRLIYSATGRITSAEAGIAFGQRAGAGNDGERRIGSFRGKSDQGGGGYWSGIYGYTVADGQCRSTFHHGRDDPNFVAGILTTCNGPCGQ